ncbi:MAG TPA: glycosyltransferase family 39 protein [Candidatus Sulfotelmatobacter sp.]|jgi:4-amino-4-deoxy-L-arabinose transferase-like glycosyltransferase|nr:glycosyltransferase family 39 protein [Candidatus Sulfotelmatobacter sp.]
MKRVRVRSRWILVCLFALSAALYVGTAGSPALDDEDVDAAHAMVSQEMLQRHDFVVPYMDGLRYLIRPPMHFWLVAASYKLLGETEFATRLPLGLAMVGMVLLTFEFGRRFFGRRAGVYAALAVATSLGMFIFTRIMIPEAIYALAFEGIFYLFLRSWTGSLDARVGYWGAAALCAVAVLTRALIGLLFPAAAIVLFITLTRGWKRWRELRLFSSSAIFLAIAAPWHILAGLRSPGFFWAYFINEHINRALGTRIPHDYGAVPLWIWWTAHLAWLFPWSFFFPLALRNFRFSPRAWSGPMSAHEQARLLLFVWAGVILFFFTIESGSRMEYYSFGAWPAICLLIGAGIAEAEKIDHAWLKPIQRVLAGLAVCLAAVAAYLVRLSIHIQAASDVSSHLDVHSPEKYMTSMAHVLDLTPQSMADLRIPLIVSAVSILIAFVAAWIFRERRFVGLPNVALALGMVGVFVAAEMAYGVLNPTLSSRSIAFEIERYLRPGDQIALYGDIRVAPGVAFYSHRNVLLYNAMESNLQFGSQYPDAPKRFYDDEDFSKLWNGSGRVFLVVPQEEELEARAHLPRNSVWEFASSGGKAVYLNQPFTTARIGGAVSAPSPTLVASTKISSGSALSPFAVPRSAQAHPRSR